MEQRVLGGTGIEVSRVILGCGNFGGIGSAPEFFGQGESEDEAEAILDAAWSAGITTYDTADAYGGWRSETWLGRWVARTGHPVTLSTKVFHSTAGEPGDTGLAPDRIRRQIRSSLERLGVDRVDMYLVHEPDPETPLAETMRVLDELVREGLVGSIGASNVDRAYLEEAREISEREGLARFEWVQNSYSMLDREAEVGVLPFCADHGLGFTPFSPLAGGWLTGKYTRDAVASGGLADDDAAGAVCPPADRCGLRRPRSAGGRGGAARHPHVDARDGVGAVASERDRHRVRPPPAGAPLALGQRGRRPTERGGAGHAGSAVPDGRALTGTVPVKRRRFPRCQALSQRRCCAWHHGCAALTGTVPVKETPRIS